MARDLLATRGDPALRIVVWTFACSKAAETRHQNPGLIREPKLKTPVDYDQVAEGVPEQGALCPFHGDLPEGVLHVQLTQQDARGWGRRATQV